MNSLKRTLPLLVLAMLSACAATQSPAPVRAPVAASDAANASPAADDARYPKIALTPELLFGVLASEIAAQRGAIGSAAVTELTLAKQTRDPRLAERAAQFALVAGNLASAEDALNLWLTIDPDSVRAREQLGAVALRTGKLQESQRLIGELLAKEPEMAVPVFVQLARSAAESADKTGFYAMVDSLAASYPDLPEARFALLAAAAEVDRQDVIDRQFDRLAVLAPKWDLPVAWQAERLRKAQPEAAIAFLKKELARRPDASLELKMAYPRLLVAQKHFPEARQAFEALLAKAPRQPELLYATGLLSFQLGDLPAARRDLETALAEHYPDTDFLEYSLGQIAEAQDDLKTAANWYRQIGEGNQYTPAQVRLAFIEARGGEAESAIARLSRLGSTPEEKVQLTLAQAEIARGAKRDDLAYALLTRALHTQPKQPDLLYERALVADMRKDTAGAERDLRQVLKLEPDNQEALNALGYILTVRTTRYQEAFGLIERALKIEPDNAMIIDSMGWVLFKLGHGEESIKYLQRAYALLPDQEVAAHYGEVLWSLGRQGEARALWEKARQATQEHPELDETMHRLMVP
ncbi:tetratricopeptide repeat protein [Paludibacterium purpuratum]|nr:tetratricopeptide repeat protein [Paludibacterium purpuratum]